MKEICKLCDKEIKDKDSIVYIEYGNYESKAKKVKQADGHEYKPYFNAPDNNDAFHNSCFVKQLKYVNWRHYKNQNHVIGMLISIELRRNES